MGSTIRKRKMYEGFLSKVKILGKALWFKSDIRGMFGNFPLSAAGFRIRIRKNPHIFESKDPDPDPQKNADPDPWTQKNAEKREKST